ncbi:hypothetical protein FGO68_gene14757 [Halteria grandinella]|uniref:Geranylgeranyl pyrophosphate synthase n=1 Tax=Halteria grandinella TaxID=5974 RepID=A0A8J8NZE3_HALGN|nr:hypothetical protein FGO68_gene14757 [Halteria grandinella]
MISRASRMLTEVFETTHISQIFSTILYNLVFGELIQAKRDMSKKGSQQEDSYNIDEYFNSYIAKTYYKTASMISLGCRGLGIIYDLDIDAQRKLFDFGAHLGIAFQVHDDILDYTQNSEQLGKPAYNDIKEGIVTAPLVYALVELQQQEDTNAAKLFEQSLKRKCEGEGDVQQALSLLQRSSGIEVADQLSIEHIRQSLRNLGGVRDKRVPVRQQQQGIVGGQVIDFEEKHAQALIGLALKVKTRKH